MIKIQKGKTVLKVPKGAFDAIYKKYGWKCESDVRSEEESKAKKAKKSKKKPEKPEIIEEETAEELEAEETPTEDSEAVTPLSEMSLNELKAFAKEHNIDISGASKAADIRGIIEAETEE